MRITTKVIQGNSIANINTNKVLQDKLNNQMATEKKIVRPSDDPVVAIRALRLRTNVSQVTQYYEKNVTDAESWMKVTEDSLTTVSSVLTDMVEQCTKGSSEKLTPTDRNTILDALKALRDEVYATGNADYAGRSVFTGYRTETTVKFTASESKQYEITEQINNNVLDSVTFINSDYLNGLNDANYNNGSYVDSAGAPNNNTDIVEQSISEQNIYRIRLAYDNVDGVVPQIKLYDPNVLTLNPDATVAEQYTESVLNITPDVVSQTNAYSPYQQMADFDKSVQAVLDAGGSIDTDGSVLDAGGNPVADPANAYNAILIPETGELLISKAVYEKMMKLSDDVTTPNKDESQIQITYQKTTWKKDDLKPEHYFACTDMSDDTQDPPLSGNFVNHIKYNTDYLSGIVEKQAIEYDVGLNQSIRINTTADEVFTHAIGRDVDDLVNSMQAVIDMDETVERLKKIRDGLKQDGTYEENYRILTNQIDAAEKSLTFLKEKNQKLFEGGISKMQEHLDKVNEATTACGTREKKLDLIKNRLMSQKTNFETLESENENVEITDVALQLKGAELTYQAALMSTSKILQTSLMQYI